MTPQQVRAVLADYDALLEKNGAIAVRNHEASTRAELLNHLRWMCGEACLTTEHGKACRWLGFIQGAFWVLGFRTIDQMRADNKEQQMSPCDFGWALEKLRAGYKVQREGWNGKGMWIRFIERSGDIEGFEIQPWIGMKTADDKFVPWVTSQADVLATDWQLVE